MTTDISETSSSSRYPLQHCGDRLDIMGFDESYALDDFNSGRKALLDHAVVGDEEAVVLERLTPDEWLTALAQVRSWERARYRTPKEDRDKLLSPVADCLQRIQASTDFLDLVPFDPRCMVRAALARLPPGVEVFYEIDSVLSGEDDESIFPAIDRKLLILTEGHTDANAIRAAFSVVYPHLDDYVAFLDFESSNYGGGAPSLVNVVRAFAGAGIANRMVAVFDNDAAAAEARVGLRDVKLPPNIRVVTLPETPLTKEYPCLIPGGGSALSDVTGMAASIELYFGKDVLRQDGGGLMPIQWHGYKKHLERYQGELLDKRAVQERFRQKVERCLANPELRRDDDWTDMRAVLDMIRTAFSSPCNG